MILSDGEWRRLRHIEMELAKEDPALAEALRRWQAPGPQTRQRRATAALGDATLCALLAFVLTNVSLAVLAGVAVLGGW